MKRNRIAEIHFYEWRIGAWILSETRDMLDAAGRGIYRELLDHCYGSGKIPDDPEWICRRCACTEEQFEKAWKVIKKHFPMIEGTQHRYCVLADIFRKEYFSYVEKQREYGKTPKSNRVDNANRINELEMVAVGYPEGSPRVAEANGNGNGNIVLTTNSTESTNSICATDVAQEKRPLRVWYDSAFAEWYGYYWLHKSKTQSRKAYEKAINLTHDKNKLNYNSSKLFLLEQVKLFRTRFESTPDWDAVGKLHPSTFLNNQRWTDECADLNGSAPKSIYTKG